MNIRNFAMQVKELHDRYEEMLSELNTLHLQNVEQLHTTMRNDLSNIFDEFLGVNLSELMIKRDKSP